MGRIIMIVISEMSWNMEQGVWSSWVEVDTETDRWQKIRGIDGTSDEWVIIITYCLFNLQNCITLRLDDQICLLYLSF